MTSSATKNLQKDPSSNPSSNSKQALMTSGRSSVIDSIWGCTLPGLGIPKEELRNKITIPEYIRIAMREAITAKDDYSPNVKILFETAHAAGVEAVVLPEAPLVVFINSRSGGRHGPELKGRLQMLMGEEQVLLLFY